MTMAARKPTTSGKAKAQPKPAKSRGPAKAPKAATPRASRNTPPTGKPGTRQIMSAVQLRNTLEALAEQVHRDFPEPAGLMVLGIRTRGAVLAERLRDFLKARYKAPVGLGTLDITLYRDDLSALGPQPNVRDSELPFDVTGAKVILVDDVLYTGRTIRAALDEIVDFGRPALIRLLVLVDRGWREYPIQADYFGARVETRADESVQVLLSEIEDEDRVVVIG